MKNWHGVTFIHLILIIIIIGIAWINFNSFIPEKEIRDMTDSKTDLMSIKVMDIGSAEKVTQDVVYNVKSLDLYMGKFVWIKNVSIISSKTFNSKKGNRILKVTLQDSLLSSIEGVFLHEDWSIFTKALIRSGKKFDLLIKVNTFNEKTSFNAKVIKLSTESTLDKESKLKVKSLASECDKSDFKSCYEIALVFIKKELLDEARIPLKKACDGLVFEACFSLADLKLKEGDVESAMVYYENACDGFHIKACFALGVRESMQQGNDLKAMKHFKMACDGGEMLSCYNLGVLLLNDKKFTAAMELMRKACNNGIGSACYNLGVNSSGNDDFVKAEEYFAMACKAGDKAACDASDRLGRINRL